MSTAAPAVRSVLWPGWSPVAIHRWGARWCRNNDPTIVEVVDPQRVGAPGNINSGPPVRLFVEFHVIYHYHYTPHIDAP